MSRVSDSYRRGRRIDTQHVPIATNLEQFANTCCVLRPTQPSPLSGTENDYQPMSGDALRLGVKAGVNRVWW